MKVLFITTVPAPYKTELFNQLAKYCDLTVLFEREKDIERDDRWYGNDLGFRYVFLSKHIQTNRMPLPRFNIVKFLTREYDHIILDGYFSSTLMFAIDYMRVHKIPYIQYVDGGIINDDSKLKYSLKRHYISSASMWLTSGGPTTEYLVHYGAKQERCAEYPFTSLTEEDIMCGKVTAEERKRIKNSLGIMEEKVILSVGRFIHGKGFDILLKSLNWMNKDIGVYIIGGECIQEYADLVKEYHLTNVHFLPFMPAKELQNHYVASDLFVLPTRSDVWGLVINEAMACRLPVISTDKCVAAVTLLDRDCIVPVNDEKALAEKMKCILENSDLAEYYAERNYCVIKDYTIEKMAARIAEVLENKNTI